MNSLTPASIRLPGPRIRCQPRPLPSSLFAASQGASTSATRMRVRGTTVDSLLTVTERVVDAGGSHILLASLTEIRLLLPDGLDLSPLAGHVVSLSLAHTLHSGGDATVDLRIEHQGELLLWARDGRPPTDPMVPLVSDHGVARVLGRVVPSGTGRDVGGYHALVLRAAPSDVSFVIVAR